MSVLVTPYHLHPLPSNIFDVIIINHSQVLHKWSPLADIQVSMENDIFYSNSIIERLLVCSQLSNDINEMSVF